MELLRVASRKSGVEHQQKNLPDLIITIQLSRAEIAMVQDLARKRRTPTEGLHAKLGQYEYSDNQKTGYVTFTILAERQLPVFKTTEQDKIAKQLIILFGENIARLHSQHC